VINPQDKKYIIQMNPEPHRLGAQIRPYKGNAPVHPVINNITAPTYILTKFTLENLNKLIFLKNEFNIKFCNIL
jgi:hypothetical protein